MTNAITNSINLDLRNNNDNDHPEFREGDDLWHLILAEGEELARLERVLCYKQHYLVEDIMVAIDFGDKQIPNIERERNRCGTPAERLAACRADYAAAFGKGP